MFSSFISGGVAVHSLPLREKSGWLGVLAAVCFVNYASQAWAVDASPAGLPIAREPLKDFTESPYVKDRLAVHVEHNYFDWHDDTDRSGRQNITPITLTYRYSDFDFGLRRAYIESTNTSPGREGSVATWSDTSLSASYTLKNLSWPVRFSLDYNLPNGMATLSGNEKNAIMDGSLVPGSPLPLRPVGTSFPAGEVIVQPTSRQRLTQDESKFYV